MVRIPYKTSDDIIVIDALFKGPKSTKIIKLVLDTGASVTSIPTDIAIAIGIDPTNPIKKIEIITASGTEYVPVVIVPFIQILGFKLRHIEIACLNLPPQSNVSGLLGLNILSKFNVLLKFRKNLLEINDD